ncbi:hypothetical protein [Nitrosopumilus sp.]|uniref:hypothetical protein n=1 Tax=Nitrosopumilus sp. TaxID=2024843 RepID=UPI003D117A69
MYIIKNEDIKTPSACNLGIRPNIEIIWSDLKKAEKLKQEILENQKLRELIIDIDFVYALALLCNKGFKDEYDKMKKLKDFQQTLLHNKVEG